MSYGPPGTTLRLCDWPPCHASFDMLAVMEGKERAREWRINRDFSLEMCGTHVPLTFGPNYEGLHWPFLDRATLTSSCSCGFPLTKTSRPRTVSTAFYRAHLLDLVCELGGALYPRNAPYACAVADCAKCATENPNGVFSRTREDST